MSKKNDQPGIDDWRCSPFDLVSGCRFSRDWSYPGFHGAQIAGAVIGLVVLIIVFSSGERRKRNNPLQKIIIPENNYFNTCVF